MFHHTLKVVWCSTRDWISVDIFHPYINMISTQMIPENGTNRIINDENIHTNVSRQTNGHHNVLGKEKKVLSDPSKLVVVNSASVSPKKKLSVRDLAKAFQGKTTNPSNVPMPMPMDGRSRSSSVPSGGGMYPFSYPTLNNGLSHHSSYGSTNSYHMHPTPSSQVDSDGGSGGSRSRSSSLHGDNESHHPAITTASQYMNSSLPPSSSSSSSFSPASAIYTHNTTTSTSSHPSQSIHSTGNFSIDSSSDTRTRASSIESGVDYSAPGTFAERASMFARLAARAQPSLPQSQGTYLNT